MGPTGGTDEVIVHGTAVALGGEAVLLRGAPGAGKSDLALRAIAHPFSCLLTSMFELVADDQVVIRRDEHGLTVSAHPRLKGLIEVRGLGIMTVPSLAQARLTLLADLGPASEVERMPDPWPRDLVLGIGVPVLRIAPFEPSAPLKLGLALAQRPWLRSDP